MPDRRRLAAPLAAQAAAFVVVLIVGVFTGHTSKAAQAPTSTGTPAATASSSKGAPRKLTVRAVQQTTGGLSLAGSPVSVLQTGSLASVSVGVLDSSLEYAANVPAGKYQVCVNPPIGWTSAVHSTHSFGTWICTTADVTAGPAAVTFRLTSRLSQVSP